MMIVYVLHTFHPLLAYYDHSTTMVWERFMMPIVISLRTLSWYRVNISQTILVFKVCIVRLHTNCANLSQIVRLSIDQSNVDFPFCVAQLCKK